MAQCGTYKGSYSDPKWIVKFKNVQEKKKKKFLFDFFYENRVINRYFEVKNLFRK